MRATWGYRSVNIAGRQEYLRQNESHGLRPAQRPSRRRQHGASSVDRFLTRSNSTECLRDTQGMHEQPRSEGGQRRYILGAFDRPVLRDPWFWFGVSWAVIFAIAIGFDRSDSTWPLWADLVFGAITFFFLMGYPPALIRRTIRAARANRRRGGTTSDGVSPSRALGSAQEPERRRPDEGAQSTVPPHESVSVTVFNESAITESSELRQGRTTLPYPIARAARLMQLGADTRAQYDHMLDLTEAAHFCLGMLSAAWLRQYAPRDVALGSLYSAYRGRGVSQGHWHEVMKSAERSMVGHDAALVGFVEAVRPLPRNAGLLPDLRRLTEERNRSAHGARPHNNVEAAQRLDDCLPVLERVLATLRFLEHHPWWLIQRADYDRRLRRFRTRVGEAMGDHPEFETKLVETSTPLAPDAFYVSADIGFLDLSPFLIMTYCELCRQREVCWADRLDVKHGVSLKSVERGHQVWSQDWVTEFQQMTTEPPPGNTGSA